MISGLFFLNLKGEIIISRYYRENVSKTALDAFRANVIAAKKSELPVNYIDETSFLCHRYGDVYVAAATRANTNPALVFQFIYKMVDVFRAYFGGSFSDDNIRDNFVLVHELLDECADFGYPQITAVNILSSFIKVGDVKSSEASLASSSASEGITSEITGSVDWRQPNKYKYRKNEVYLDVMERINVLMNGKGEEIRSDLTGKVIMKTQLTGMPECTMALNDKLQMEKDTTRRHNPNSGIALDDVAFHRCVKLTQFDQDRLIRFVPPDGEFELMKYRINSNINLPFRVIAVVSEMGRTRVEYDIKIKGTFGSKLSGSNVLVKIPTPPNTAKVNVTVPVGKWKYIPTMNAIVWKIKSFPDNASYLFKGSVKMVAGMTDKVWVKPPISLEFDVPMYAASGIHIRYLNVQERSNYETSKWHAYLTKAGNYQIKFESNIINAPN